MDVQRDASQDILSHVVLLLESIVEYDLQLLSLLRQHQHLHQHLSLFIHILLDHVLCHSPGSHNADAFSLRRLLHSIILKPRFGDLHSGKFFILSQNSVIILLCGSIS